MPSNEIVINGSLKFEIPDSWMPPLMEYLKMVTKKINTGIKLNDEEAREWLDYYHNEHAKAHNKLIDMKKILSGEKIESEKELVVE